MSFMFEVYYKPPVNALKEAALTDRVAHLGGRLDFREEPDGPASGGVCLTYEFDDLESATKARLPSGEKASACGPEATSPRAPPSPGLARTDRRASGRPLRSSIETAGKTVRRKSSVGCGVSFRAPAPHGTAGGRSQTPRLRPLPRGDDGDAQSARARGSVRTRAAGR